MCRTRSYYFQKGWTHRLYEDDLQKHRDDDPAIQVKKDEDDIGSSKTRSYLMKLTFLENIILHGVHSCGH